MRPFRVPFALLGLVLVTDSCGGGMPPAGVPGEPTPEPAPSPTTCVVVFRVSWSSPDDATRVLDVVAENVSARAVDFNLPNRCPAGPLDFAGLPPGYDYYGTCNAGACLGSRHAVHVHLDPGERRPVVSTPLAVGGSTCTQPLPPAYYEVGAIPPPTPIGICAESAALDLRAGAPRPRPPPAPGPIAPQPQVRLAPTTSPAVPLPAATATPGAECTSSADCALSCPQVPGCCGWACGCRNAMPRDRVAGFEAAYAKSCTRPPHCPEMGCAYEPASSAQCVNGRCVAITGATVRRP